MLSGLEISALNQMDECSVSVLLISPAINVFAKMFWLNVLFSKVQVYEQMSVCDILEVISLYLNYQSSR